MRIGAGAERVRARVAGVVRALSCAGLAGGVLLAPFAARAQRAVVVRADNDAFNFWQQPWARPDEEYTSGVRLTLDYDGVAPWARHLTRAARACRETAPCESHTYALGQDIYTAVRSPRDSSVVPNGRPDAGVLWVSSTTRFVRPSTLLELGLTFGVTGKPSLAEPMQRFFHALAPSFNRPITWGRQVPTEPVFAASLDARRIMRVGALEMQPHAGASLGNLLTEGRAGVGARLGRAVLHPWLAMPRRPAFDVALVGDASARAVARNEVLNGALFRRSVRVTPRPFVTELEGGVRIRWRMFEAAWVAHQTSAEYVTRTAPHVWSTLEAGWYRGR